MWYITLIYLRILKHPFIPEVNPSSPWYMKLLTLKHHNLKVESFIWWEILGIQAQETASQVTLRELLRGKEVRLYISLSQRADSLNLKRLLLIKENQISQVKEFSAFYVWEGTRAWAL